MHFRNGCSGLGAETSKALVCQLSVARALGNQPGSGIMRYLESTAMYGSYMARNSARVPSSPDSLRNATPESDSILRSRANSSSERRLPSCLRGEVLKI